ncbi:MAG: archaeosortase/exosortase family protein, partial [Candidatus Didemnitutus sp.]|nr:archaeosortase/exosortase family protein [Candidatus Didemnitutus sp.]
MNETAHRYARATRDWFRSPLPWVVGPLAVFVGAFSIHLWPEWTKNPDLSHGMFALLVFALLMWEGVRTGTQRWLPATIYTRFGVSALIVGAVLLFALAGLLAASVGWTHAIVNFVLAASLVAALLAGLFVLAAKDVRAVPFNWPVLTAIGLWLLVANIPPGTYSRLTLSFQGSVTTGVLHALHLFGVPARQIGNVIELANTSVGVE